MHAWQLLRADMGDAQLLQRIRNSQFAKIKKEKYWMEQHKKWNQEFQIDNVIF